MKQSTWLICLIVAALIGQTAQGKISIGGTEVTSSAMHYLTYARHWRVPQSGQNGPIWESGDAANLVGKTPEEIDQIAANIAALEVAPFYPQIDERMRQDTEVFSFASAEDLRKECVLRFFSVYCMRWFNAVKNFWYTQKKAGSTFETTSSYWAYHKGGKSYLMYQKASVTAYDAIVDIVDNLIKTEGECYTAACICIWWGQRMALGKDGFNAKWPSSSEDTRLVTKFVADDKANYRAKLTRYVNTIFQVGHVFVPGDWTYMQNHNYNEVITDTFARKLLDKEKRYLFSGENAFYAGTNAQGVEIYTGLGLNDLTESEMRDSMRDAYNTELLPVINHPDGKINEQKVVLLLKIPADDAKIRWIGNLRVHN